MFYFHVLYKIMSSRSSDGPLMASLQFMLRERPFDFYEEGWKIYFSLGIFFFTILYPGFLFFVKEDPGFFFHIYTFQKLYIKC